MKGIECVMDKISQSYSQSGLLDETIAKRCGNSYQIDLTVFSNAESTTQSKLPKRRRNKSGKRSTSDSKSQSFPHVDVPMWFSLNSPYNESPEFVLIGEDSIVSEDDLFSWSAAFYDTFISIKRTRHISSDALPVPKSCILIGSEDTPPFIEKEELPMLEYAIKKCLDMNTVKSVFERMSLRIQTRMLKESDNIDLFIYRLVTEGSDCHHILDKALSAIPDTIRKTMISTKIYVKSDLFKTSLDIISKHIHSCLKSVLLSSQPGTPYKDSEKPFSEKHTLFYIACIRKDAEIVKVLSKYGFLLDVIEIEEAIYASATCFHLEHFTIVMNTAINSSKEYFATSPVLFGSYISDLYKVALYSSINYANRGVADISLDHIETLSDTAVPNAENNRVGIYQKRENSDVQALKANQKWKSVLFAYPKNLVHTCIKNTRMTCIIKRLLMKGYDPDERDPLNYTPLMLAAFRGDSQAVEILLSSKADITKDIKVFELAIISRHFSILKTLLADVDMKLRITAKIKENIHQDIPLSDSHKDDTTVVDWWNVKIDGSCVKQKGSDGCDKTKSQMSLNKDHEKLFQSPFVFGTGKIYTDLNSVYLDACEYEKNLQQFNQKISDCFKSVLDGAWSSVNQKILSYPDIGEIREIMIHRAS